MKKNPDFVCIGFQKCGTTTLYDLLKQHANIYLTEVYHDLICLLHI